MSKENRPAKVRSVHLKRRCVVYIRQSTDVQVRENEGSTTYQREQVRYPLGWGWPPDVVEVIDEDLGRSGATTILRTGFQRMLKGIVSNEIGAIFCANLSRFSRSNRDAVMLVDECRNHDVLLVENGRIFDVRDRNDRFFIGMIMNIAEFENDGRAETFHTARRAKAAKGITVSQPPAGYVSQKGVWKKDPDPTVQAAVAAVFRFILEERSLVKAVARMVREGMKLPRRRGAFVEWVPPDVGKIGFIARNRAFRGVYVFRKNCVDRSLGYRGNGRVKERPALPEEMIVVPDNHEAYVTREEWDEIQHILDINAPWKQRRNLGPGGATLQGVIRCGMHNCAMSARKKGNLRGNVRVYSYACPGEQMRGGSGCISVTARPIEQAVVAAIMRYLQPPTVESIRQGWTEARRVAADEQSRQDLEVARLRREVEDLRRRCTQIDVANPRIATELETQWNAAERDLARVEAHGSAPSPLDAFTPENFDELVALCEDLGALWHAETTQDRDHKEIVRTMISAVILEERTTEEFKVRIRWADGAPDEQLSVKRNAYAHRIIDELAAQGLDAEAIAERLNDMGLRTLKDNTWTKTSIVMAHWRRGKRSEA